MAGLDFLRSTSTASNGDRGGNGQSITCYRQVHQQAYCAEGRGGSRCRMPGATAGRLCRSAAASQPHNGAVRDSRASLGEMHCTEVSQSCDASVQYMFCDPKDFATLIIDFSSVGATSAPGQTRSLCDVGSSPDCPKADLEHASARLQCTVAVIAAIRRTKRYGRFAGVAGSIRFEARELHHLAPLLSFLGDKLTEVGRRAWKCDDA
jgi:hypothetical protein